MSDSLPARADRTRAASHALDPTQVIPGPRPMDRVTADSKVIAGEVFNGRHRAPRTRRLAPGAVGAAVLSATGIVAGLSWLVGHDPVNTSASRGPQHEPATSAPDRSPEQSASPSPGGTASPTPSAQPAQAAPAPRHTAARVTEPAASSRTVAPATAPAAGGGPGAGSGQQTGTWVDALEAAYQQDGSPGYAGGSWQPGGHGHRPGPRSGR